MHMYMYMIMHGVCGCGCACGCEGVHVCVCACVHVHHMFTIKTPKCQKKFDFCEHLQNAISCTPGNNPGNRSKTNNYYVYMYTSVCVYA
jgi:hypothetical protein